MYTYDEYTIGSYVSWESVNKASTIHRMAVNFNIQRCGIVSAFLKHTEHVAIKRKHSHIKLDIYSLKEQGMKVGKLMEISFYDLDDPAYLLKED